MPALAMKTRTERDPSNPNWPSRVTRIAVALITIGLLPAYPAAGAEPTKRSQPQKKNPPAPVDYGSVTGPSLPGSKPASSKDKAATAKPKADKPAADDGGWNTGDSEGTGILLKSWATDVLFPVAPSDLVLVENVVYNARNGEQVGEFNLPKENIHKRSLSPDGKHLAIARSQQGVEVIEIYEWDKNAPSIIPWKEKVRVESLHFISDTRLLAWMDGKKTHLITWDLEKNKVLRDFTTPVDGRQESALSESGKYLAVPDGGDLAIVDVVSGKRVGKMSTAKKQGLQWVFLTGLAFSPDEKELGAVFGNRLLVWSNRGKIIFDQTCNRDIRFSGRGARGLSWFPDGKAWLLGGRTVLDRESRLFVFELPFDDSYAQHAPARVLDDSHILSASASGRQGEYRVTTVPWDLIRETVAAAKADKDPVIGPGHPISIEINLGGLRFANPDEVRTDLYDALKERLQQAGIAVEPSQSSVIRLDYSEVAGQTKEVVTGIGVVRQRTGINLTESVGSVRMALLAEGADKPHWESAGKADAGGVIRGELTDAQLRKEMFERIIRQIDQIAIPNYIPRDPNGVRLPIIAGGN